MTRNHHECTHHSGVENFGVENVILCKMEMNGSPGSTGGCFQNIESHGIVTDAFFVVVFLGPSVASILMSVSQLMALV